MTKKRNMIMLLLVFVCMFAFPILAQAEVKTLRMMLWSSPEPDTRRIIEEFEKKNPDIRVVLDVVSYNNLYDKATMTLMGEGEMDMVFGHSLWTVSWANEGFLMNLDKYIPMLDKDDFYESMWNASLYRGSLYGIPHHVNVYAMVYNRDMFEKAGIDPNKPPKTWEEFLSYSKKLTNPPEQYGFGLMGAAGSAVWLNILPFVYQNKGNILNEECTEARINEKPAVEAIQFWGDLLVKHNVAPKGSVGNSDEQVIPLFSQSRVAMMWIGQFVYQHIERQAPDLLEDNLVGSALLPKGKQMATAALPWPVMIAAHTEYPDECFNFAKFMTSTEMVTQSLSVILPVIESAAKAERFHTPRLEAFNAMVEYARSVPATAQWPSIERAIVAGAQEVLMGKGAQQAMDDVAAEINKALTEK